MRGWDHIDKIAYGDFVRPEVERLKVNSLFHRYDVVQEDSESWRWSNINGPKKKKTLQELSEEGEEISSASIKKFNRCK